MTKLPPTPAGAVLVAIDMSKNRQEVLIERPEGGRRRRLSTDRPLTASSRGLTSVGATR